jgi:hypothetical protein
MMILLGKSQQISIEALDFILNQMKTVKLFRGNFVWNKVVHIETVKNKKSKFMKETTRMS